MKRAAVTIGILCCAMLLLAACSSRHPQAEASSRKVGNPPRRAGTTIPDKILVKDLVFRDLGVGRVPWGAADFGYYIVEVESDERTFFEDLYRRSSPDVKVCVTGTGCIDNSIDDELQDRRTKRHCVALSAGVTFINKETAVADAAIRSGKLGGELYRYTLKREKEGWKILFREVTGAI